MSKMKIGLVGVGKIARDQHLPILAKSSDFDLVAVASRHNKVAGVANFDSVDSMLARYPEIQAVTFCSPPQGRHAMVRHALAQGRHVMLEKPPGATLSEVESLIALARHKERSLFATWHSRYAAAVKPARAWLAKRRLQSVHVTAKEDVRIWHPGQSWIWEPGGLGVFDPGINGLSIVTALLPESLILVQADLDFPVNCQAPIAARMSLADLNNMPVTADFDFLQTGEQSWDIRIETNQGTLLLQRGGAIMSVDGVQTAGQSAADYTGLDTEYRGLYARFAELVRSGTIDADLAPFRLVADSFLIGRRHLVEAFAE